METHKRRFLYGLVWDWRCLYEHIYPTPGRIDSAHFFLQEYTEALDAHIRLNPKYLRNNKKQLSVEDELGDCAFMLITALGREYNPNWDHWQTNLSGCGARGIELIGIHVLRSWLWIVERGAAPPLADNEIWKSLGAIDSYTNGIEPFIRKKLDILYNKHVVPVTKE